MADWIDTIVPPFLAKVDGVLGDGYTAVLFGSVARGEHVEGRSDVNLMLITERADPSTLRSLHDAFAAWRRASRTAPILITRDEWARAADAFPIELCDMKAAYRVLRGPDLVAGATVDPRDLRRALEHALRGKLLRLRQAYVVYASDPAALGQVAAESAATITLLLRCVLAVAGRPVPPSADTAAAAAADLIGFPAGAVQAAAHLRGERKPRLAAPEFEAYVDAVVRTAHFVDQLQLGDHS
jgi:predicted nucleotidyltransferase